MTKERLEDIEYQLSSSPTMPAWEKEWIYLVDNSLPIRSCWHVWVIAKKNVVNSWQCETEENAHKSAKLFMENSRLERSSYKVNFGLNKP